MSQLTITDITNINGAKEAWELFEQASQQISEVWKEMDALAQESLRVEGNSPIFLQVHKQGAAKNKYRERENTDLRWRIRAPNGGRHITWSEAQQLVSNLPSEMQNYYALMDQRVQDLVMKNRILLHIITFSLARVMSGREGCNSRTINELFIEYRRGNLTFSEAKRYVATRTTH